MLRRLLLLVLTLMFTLPQNSEGQSCGACEQPPLWECEQWDPVQCLCLYINPGSPIVVELVGTGLKLTSAADGVRFDIRGDGRLLQIAWTARDSQAAFLALDRNGNGRIDNGKELFGNFTMQPPSDSRNGFVALAEYDKQSNGGNADGIN